MSQNGPHVHKVRPSSCFALLGPAVERVGLFDENFYPAYHEDYDYMVRMSRAGVWKQLVATVRVQHGWSKWEEYKSGMVEAAKVEANRSLLAPLAAAQRRHGRGSGYYAMKWGRAETVGVYSGQLGHWNQTCTEEEPVVCRPASPKLHPNPFNDTDLPATFWKLDPNYRRCIVKGPAPCTYNISLLPHPERLPAFAAAAQLWPPAPSEPGVWLETDGSWEIVSHSDCHYSNCTQFPPTACVDGDQGSFFVMRGTRGEVVIDLRSCWRISRIRVFPSRPPDPSDTADVTVALGRSIGQWDSVGSFHMDVASAWGQSPAFDARGRFVRLTVEGNRGYPVATRLVDVGFFAAGPCDSL
eukprot:TRINITY_DN7230_c0_g1_i1.p1 TRINITY_DN7230_c0_g1~~TRINITY_DN7230_c0_g1_i1.p1  ORF type:complete len:355 (-),score=49.76 TRINITY_DN7230_c0_g1_i1:45-1109(-)